MVKENYFIDTGVAGIDGISYTRQAEPVAFPWLQSQEGLPEEFLTFSLTLKVDGRTVRSIPFHYGDNLDELELPSVPEKNGYYGQWPEFVTTGVSSDILLEAVYTPWVTLVASQEMDGKRALALVDGTLYTGGAAACCPCRYNTAGGAARSRRGQGASMGRYADWPGSDGGGPIALTSALRRKCGGLAVSRWTVDQSGDPGGRTVYATDTAGDSGIFCVQTEGPTAAALSLVLIGVVAVLGMLILISRGAGG
jgi:hypothetical protein